MTYFENLNLEEMINGGDFSQLTLKDGLRVEHKRINLDPPQMDMFTFVDVTKLQDGTVWLDFHSSKYAPNKTLMDFMAHCYELWGLDSFGRGVPSESDVPALKDGSFARDWDNVKILQVKTNENFSLSIALRIIINNEDMSNFMNQLAKGFVRSAVNQIGRDGGRVISNQIYNGQNYVPVADVTPNSPRGMNTPPFNNGNDIKLPPDAYSTVKPFSTGKIILLVVLSIFLCPIGAIGVLIYGLSKYFDRTEKIEWIETVPQYVTDRRYNSGMRLVGYTNVKKHTTLSASPTALAINKRKAIVAISISLPILLITMLSVWLS